MAEYAGRIFDVLVALTVLTTALAIGLNATPDLLRRVVANRRPAVAMLAVNGLFVPVAAFGLVRWLPVGQGQKTGILLCAICVCGPLGLKAAQIARGDLVWAFAVIAGMTVLNAAFLPLWTAVLLTESIPARPLDILGAIVMLMIIPMVVGIVARQRRPRAARLANRRLQAVSTVTLVLAIVIGLTLHLDELLSPATSWTVVVAVLLIALAGAAAYGASGPPSEVRRVAVLASINRGTGLALLVAGYAFAGQRSVLASVIAFGILQTTVVFGVALLWRTAWTASVQPS
jgi:bile acid:Na+ symporter, BASS family